MYMWWWQKVQKWSNLDTTPLMSMEKHKLGSGEPKVGVLHCLTILPLLQRHRLWCRVKGKLLELAGHRLALNARDQALHPGGFHAVDEWILLFSASSVAKGIRTPTCHEMKTFIVSCSYMTAPTHRWITDHHSLKSYSLWSQKSLLKYSFKFVTAFIISTIRYLLIGEIWYFVFPPCPHDIILPIPSLLRFCLIHIPYYVLLP